MLICLLLAVVLSVCWLRAVWKTVYNSVDTATAYVTNDDDDDDDVWY